MRSRFIILNAMAAAICFAAWRAGLFDGFASIGRLEVTMLVALGGYFAVGLAAAWCGRWSTVRYIANALPAWGLGMTGLGLLIAASQLHSLTPDALSTVFRALVDAICPNVVGVLGYAWLSALAWWAVGEET
ncbi:MAG: hypothetical protein ACREFZ_00920 [Acetobacteraceae bacterium]